MEVQEFLLAIGSILLAWIVFVRIRLFKKMAPGPYGLPYLGSLLHLIRHNEIEEFQKYKKKYGKIFSVSVGDFYVTVVTDYRLIIENLKKDEFAGRPSFEVWKNRNLGNQNRGILFSDDPVWHEQRRFVLRGLRDFGFGKESMEGMLVHELQDLKNALRQVEKDLGQPVTLSGVFNASVLNSIWCITTGKRFEVDDPKLKRLITLLIDNLRGIKITTPVGFLFGPVKLGIFWREQIKASRKFREEIKVLIDEVISEHFETYEEGKVRDFVDAYIQQIKGSGKDQPTFNGDEGRANLYAVLLDLFVAGAETTSTTLTWAVLCLCLNPHVQRKAQEEIDNVIGRARPPSRSDKSKLIYLEAVLNEVHRVASLAPFNVYHKAMQDAQIEGHFIPKDSLVFFSIHDAHHDKDVWGDPDCFRPERFLDDSGTKIVKHEALIPFSTGKRQCLGETLARDTLFMFLCGILQSFTLELDPNDAKNIDLKGSPTFISSPKPFKVIINERV